MIQINSHKPLSSVNLTFFQRHKNSVQPAVFHNQFNFQVQKSSPNHLNFHSQIISVRQVNFQGQSNSPHLIFFRKHANFQGQRSFRNRMNSNHLISFQNLLFSVKQTVLQKHLNSVAQKFSANRENFQNQIILFHQDHLRIQFNPVNLVDFLILFNSPYQVNLLNLVISPIQTNLSSIQMRMPNQQLKKKKTPMIIGISVGLAALVGIVTVIVVFVVRGQMIAAPNGEGNVDSVFVTSSFTVSREFNPLYDDDINDSRDPYNDPDFDDDDE